MIKYVFVPLNITVFYFIPKRFLFNFLVPVIVFGLNYFILIFEKYLFIFVLIICR